MAGSMNPVVALVSVTIAAGPIPPIGTAVSPKTIPADRCRPLRSEAARTERSATIESPVGPAGCAPGDSLAAVVRGAATATKTYNGCGVCCAADAGHEHN